MMETIRSKDGTMIAYQRSGTGSPLVLVHGATADHTRWTPVLPAFEQHFTLYALDRRGRGGSGDAEQYAIEREFEDIVALVNSIEEPVFLLGHSYGALCSLEAALRTTNVRKLILYEPPIPTGIEVYPPEVVTRIQALLDAGDREGAVFTFMQDIVRVPPREMVMLRSAPSWPARIEAAHTILREMRGSNEYIFEPARFVGLTTPTLLLLGGDSPPFFRAAIEVVHAALPDSRIVIMPGQQHTAMNTAPEVFIREVLQFLAEAGQIARL
jgi:pimeloyl-ACP methyl ester carboxylesterase